MSDETTRSRNLEEPRSKPPPWLGEMGVGHGEAIALVAEAEWEEMEPDNKVSIWEIHDAVLASVKGGTEPTAWRDCTMCDTGRKPAPKSEGTELRVPPAAAWAHALQTLVDLDLVTDIEAAAAALSVPLPEHWTTPRSTT